MGGREIADVGLEKTRRKAEFDYLSEAEVALAPAPETGYFVLVRSARGQASTSTSKSMGSAVVMCTEVAAEAKTGCDHRHCPCRGLHLRTLGQQDHREDQNPFPRGHLN